MKPKGIRKRKVIPQEDEDNYRINPEQVRQDKRTTIMIKNIPNKYDQTSLIEKINKSFLNKYDFFYLPIDFSNKCNMGYAFINFIDCSYIKQFYEEFHNQKWVQFNSEKVCLLYYARLQGYYELVQHFSHSSVMNQKDKRLKPIIIPQQQVAYIKQLIEIQKQKEENKQQQQKIPVSNNQLNTTNK
ncbi:RNA recognition motif 2 family protein, putative [Ichthyophthirius multifiliis]|uniref:RNA recognition motif 2 family protein, putative n=1 Tax=Ichthyophthirius multifiliis TaxID=5932 RepID=G0QKH2_ICHMU|nr:RNA recognition motif 2 family protein, putative [Ichthyophthirius multifiliis]EGR34282.1 RNA recognition motif 2 family protein, putative [Ichthyophthirius multifiliis]|eukprot:XP_004039586.1 RNA recognition motif 2 family protein, putative [Ichthyophthirius multifiliis]